MLGVQRSLRWASANGHHSVVSELLRNPRVDPAAYGNFAIRAAAANGHTETVNALLADPRVDPSARQNQALRLASTYGHLAIVRLLLADHRELQPRGTGQALQCACVRGHDAVAEVLLADPRVRVDFPTRDARGALQGAAQRGNIAMLERLLADPRITACEGAVAGALATAGKAGNLEAVERLLCEPTASQQPAANDGGLYYAAEQGHVAIVERLLAAPHMDFDFDRVAFGAVKHGHVEVVSRLLADPRCPPRFLALGFKCAASAGHSGVVRKLLARTEAVAAYLSGALIASAEHGHEEIVGLLLAEPQLDLAAPVYDHNFFGRHEVISTATPFPQDHPQAAGVVALEAASFAGHVAILEMLLADPRLDAAAASIPALRSAAEQRRVAVVERLLADPRIAAFVPTATASEFFAKARSAASRPAVNEQEDEEKDEQKFDAAEGGWASASESESDSDDVGRVYSGLSDRLGRPSNLSKFFRAADSGDLRRLRKSLADATLDPQAPERGNAANCGPDVADYYCDRACTFALSMAAQGKRAASAVLEVLLADPCWEARHLADALAAACYSGNAIVVKRLLADPRVELSAMHEQDSAGSCFATAAESGCAEVLPLLLADLRLHHVDKAAAGREVIRALRAMQPRIAHNARRGGSALQQLLRAPAVLHACLAATAASSASESFPPFMRNLINVAAIGQQSWARRRLLVAARVRLLED